MATNKDARVYRETTVSLTQTKQNKKPRRDKSDLGENFIAPDGGWAWLVCIAAGISNLVTYACLYTYGFIFKEHLHGLGITTTEITSIINTNSAISSCTGLLNGPIFRRFTFRQVGIFAGCIIFIGLFLTSFCKTFLTYMICYSLLYGFGMGISISSSSLALNTYFKIKRRKAAGFSWAITGLGPIVLPHFAIVLLAVYGVQYTVMIFAALSLNTIVSALIYQPVKNHTLKTTLTDNVEQNTESDILCKWCEQQKQNQMARRKNTDIFSSQYLYQADDEDKPGYEITSPGTPMLARANDGWYGSKLSLSSNKTRFRTVSSSKNLEELTQLHSILEGEKKCDEEFFKPNNFKRERDQAELTNKLNGCNCEELKKLKPLEEEPEINYPIDIPFYKKIVIFFDLDLLKDMTYVNLVIGLTIINFGELNFSVLTPFILTEFGLETSQQTIAVSTLATLDIIVRFMLPFLTEKISWDNRVFFLIGVVGISMGRTVVACTRSFPVILCSFAWIGLCKGVRTVFWPLIIPGYVPLKRLPAASGLQLLITGLFGLAAGPFVGLIKEKYNYAICLHCLNLLTFIAAISWSLEAIYHRYVKKYINNNNDII